jgi:hypothetical protein
MTDCLHKVSRSKKQVQLELVTRVRHLENERDKFKGQVIALLEKNQKLDLQSRIVNKERDRYKMKVIRMQNMQKKSGGTQTKICKNCHAEYTDKENFNWSCRTHSSEWGGTVWWCCGKTEKDQPGCKFGKHTSKDDDDPAIDPADQEEISTAAQKLLRCQCCKQLGHRIDQCMHDPNLRTMPPDIDEDEIRLYNASNFRKMHVDSVVSTTHFFKKAVMLPQDLENESDGDNQVKGTANGKQNKKGPREVQQPFVRGIMQFDDYNYKAFNPYVLIE